MAMSHRVRTLTSLAALAVGGLLSGCSGGDERAEPPKPEQCETLLGAKNVEAAVKTAGGSDVEVGGTPEADVLADRFVREAKKWQESDLQHTRYTGCRMDAVEGGQSGGIVDASVKWSVLSVGMMDSPKNSRTWRRVNEAVFVAPEPGPARMQLIAVCAVPGAIASQPSDLPLQFEVAGEGLGTELRWETLRTFARSVTEEMDCAKAPVIPSALPPSA